MLFARLVLPRTTAESIISASAPKSKKKQSSHCRNYDGNKSGSQVTLLESDKGWRGWLYKTSDLSHQH